MFFSNDIFFLLPELHWVFSVVFFLLFATSLNATFRLIVFTQLGYMFLFFIFCLFLLYLQVPSYAFSLFNFQVVVDSFTHIFKLLFLVFLFLATVVSLNYFFLERIFFVEYYFLLGFFCLSAFFLASCNDLLMFYLAIELQALILYTLAAIKRYTVFSTESGLKYFVLGAFSSGLLLFGVSLFYGFCGTFNFFDIKFLLLGWFNYAAFFALIVATVFLLSAILFKLAAAPFHVWTPDVYEGAPTAIVLLFATLPKLAMFTFIVKLFIFFLYDLFSVWYAIFFFSGLLSVLIGTFAALNQFRIKRLYAYSGIVNVGYLVTLLAYGSLSGFVAIFNYLLVYIFSTLLIFLIILMFRVASNLKKVKSIPDYKIFATYSSAFAVLFSLIFFSLAGVPPLAGFFTKFFLFKTLFALDFMLNPAIFVILVTSVISAFYYIRVVRFVFFDTKRFPQLFNKLSFFCVLLLVILSFWLVFFFLFQQLYLLFLVDALSLLFL